MAYRAQRPNLTVEDYVLDDAGEVRLRFQMLRKLTMTFHVDELG